MAAVRSSRPVSASSWSPFGRNQSAAARTPEIRSRSRGLPGCSTSTATIAPPPAPPRPPRGSPSPGEAAKRVRARRRAAPGCGAPATGPRRPASSSDVAPGTCNVGRSPLGLIGRMVADVCAPLLRLSPPVSTPCLAIAAATTSPSRSSPIAPIACTAAPSLARSTPVPAAVPAAVARISVSRAPPCPGGIASTGLPSTSRMCAPSTVTWPSGPVSGMSERFGLSSAVPRGPAVR